MKTSQERAEQRQVENLSLKEVDMIYSLACIGEWTALEIGRRYRIPESDVRKVAENYAELRRTCERKPSGQGLNQNPRPEPTPKKPRKRRSDAIYATAKERQAAYRARLKERRRAGMQVPSPDPVTDSPAPIEEELSVTKLILKMSIRNIRRGYG